MSWSGLLSLLLLEEIEKDELEIEKWLENEEMQTNIP